MAVRAPDVSQPWPLRGCCDYEQECSPRWGWGGGGEETVHNSVHSRLQEGCSSEEERGLASDFVKRLSLVLGNLDSYR